MHAGPTYAFLKSGIHVICDKPLTVSLPEGKKMKAPVDKSDRIFALTRNYTGYPLVRRMREMPKGGEIQLVQVDYPRDRPAGSTETLNGASTRSAQARAGRSATSARTPSTSPSS